jgi:hypothetical protein
VVARPANGGIPRDRALAHVHEIVAATDLPLNADFEGASPPMQQASPKACASPSRPAFAEQGKFDGLSDAASGRELNSYFRK